eukprot:4722388-Pyramimonas_sp.AAC.2
MEVSSAGTCERQGARRLPFSSVLLLGMAALRWEREAHVAGDPPSRQGDGAAERRTCRSTSVALGAACLLAGALAQATMRAEVTGAAPLLASSRDNSSFVESCAFIITSAC